MQENFQITIVIIAGTILLMSLVFFIVLSAIMYQKARNSHEQNYQYLKNKYDKEILQANIEVKQTTLNKISEEIHDNVGQLLSLVKLNLYQLNKINKNERISDTIELTNTAILGLRNIAHIISSNKLDDTSLTDLLKKEIEQINKTKIIIGDLHVSEMFNDNLSSEITLILYRMSQEIINNIIKHSKATKAIINITQNKSKMHLQISDNGIGFNIDEIEGKNNGFQNLKRRAKIINADLKISSTKNIGTEVLITITNN